MRVVLWTHGGPAIGAGHAVRSVALAEQARAEGHEVVLAGTFEGDFVRRQVARSGAEVLDLRDDPDHAAVLADLRARTGADVLHVDRYDVADLLLDVPAWSDALVSNLEDGTWGRRRAHVSVDPTLGAEHDPHPGAAGLLLRGVRFAPLRAQVRSRRDRPASDGAGVDDVLVVMGGTDAHGLTGRALAALAATGLPLRVTAVLPPGVALPPLDAARLRLSVVPPVDDLAALATRHRVVVSAAGTSVTELLCLGMPAALVVATDNQRLGHDRVLARGAAVGLGDLPDLPGPPGSGAPEGHAPAVLRRLLTDEAQRAALAGAGRRLVDGLGAWRVVRTWTQLVERGLPPRGPARVGDPVRTRPAEEADAALLLRWRNDPTTRAASRAQDPVAADDHVAWLRSSLARPDRLLVVGEDARGAVGTVRWDRLEGTGEWEVSITVAPERRGEGLAAALLDAGEAHLRASDPGAATLLAAVRAENAASHRLFTSAGWTPDLPAGGDGFARYLRQPG